MAAAKPESAGAPFHCTLRMIVDPSPRRSVLLARGAPGGAVREAETALHAGREGVVVDSESPDRLGGSAHGPGTAPNRGERPGLRRPAGIEPLLHRAVQVPHGRGTGRGARRRVGVDDPDADFRHPVARRAARGIVAVCRVDGVTVGWQCRGTLGVPVTSGERQEPALLLHVVRVSAQMCPHRGAVPQHRGGVGYQ